MLDTRPGVLPGRAHACPRLPSAVASVPQWHCPHHARMEEHAERRRASATAVTTLFDAALVCRPTGSDIMMDVVNFASLFTQVHAHTHALAPLVRVLGRSMLWLRRALTGA